MRSVRAALLLGLLLTGARDAYPLDPDKRFFHYVKKTWSIEEGLPQISVAAIAQDGQGYLWAATQSGLSRFDGVRFTNYNPENTPEMPGLLTQALLADRRGDLWIGTYKGLMRHTVDGFTAIPLGAGTIGLGLDVRDIRETTDGRIVVAAPTGVFEVRNDVLVPLPGAPAVAAFGLLADGDALWIANEGGVHRLDARGVRWLPLLENGQPVTVTRLVRAHGTLWAGTNRGLYTLDDGGTWERFAGNADQSLPIDAMLEDRDGNLWIAATDVLLRVRGGQVEERIAGDSAASHRAIRAIFEDREGSLWLGSQWEGLAHLWNGWTRRHSVDVGLHEPLVWSLARDPDGRLWVGGNDGLSVFDGTAYTRVLTGEMLPHPNAYTLLPERDGLWIGTRRGLVHWHDGTLSAPPEFAALANAQINGLLRDRDGQLWIASLIGIFRHDGNFLHEYGKAAGLPDPRARLVYQTRGGRLLFGTQDGLLTLEADRLERVGADAGLPPHLDVTAIHELPDGELLVGTLSEQVFHFDGRSWFAFGREQGLPINSPFFLAHDSKGWVWVAGIRGVYRVPLEELRAIRAGKRTTADGAQMLISERGDQRGSQKGYCCNGAGNAKGFIEDDLLWLPTRGGVVTLGSQDVAMNGLAPPVMIERVRHSGEWHELHGRTTISPAPGARDFAFEFTSLSFQQPGSVGLRYRLRGYDKDWQPLTDLTRRDATYTNLPPGAYVFEVMGANNALVWNPAPAQLTFDIPPRFHESPWLYALLALATVGVGLRLHHVRTTGFRRRQLALEQQVAERTEALAAANVRLQEASQTDSLTGLRNRRFLHGQLPADLAFYLREVRKPGNEGTVMMLALADIDHFKQVNDQHGHHAGDLVLQQFSRVLERQVRSGDYVVRWGGEEFLLVFRPMPYKEATKIAERVRRAVADFDFEIEGGRVLRLTCSIGFIEYPLFRGGDAAPDWQHMVELADRALYAVKTSGRNGWATFRANPPMPLESLVEEMRDSDSALASGRIELHRSPPA